MRRAITHAHLCTCLKHLRGAKKAHTKKGVRQITHLKQDFLSFIFYKCFDYIFEIKKKENNAAVLTLLTDANLRILLY